MMMLSDLRLGASTIAGYFGAHRVPDRAGQERERALQRGVVALLVAACWAVQYVSGRTVHAPLALVPVFAVLLPAAAFAYRSFLLSRPDGGVATQYLFLLLDPIVIMSVLIVDPQTFAFLSPFMLFVIVRNGIRFGTRTMYLAWGTTLLLATLLPVNEFWRREIELTLAFLTMLALVPVLFASLIRRVHGVRAVEEQRARASATHDLALARSAFLAKVSHELRSPLQGIVSALDVIEMRHARAFEGDDELIGRMRRASMLLNTQLRDLLTLAKGEAGRLQMHAEPFEACSLVETMAEAARELAVSKGLELVVDTPDCPLFAIADAARIDQVLTNLVINSIRYTDLGHVRVSMAPVGEPLSALQFVVADTGQGIAEELLPTVFEPDRHLDSAARRGEGSGIGLAIVRTLVEHLGGTLSVSSHVGLGTTFTVAIPAEPVPEERRDFADTGTHGRVLIVDDRSEVLEALESVVDELGYEFDRAGSAVAAARLLGERSYDAVLLDLDMPTKGGAALLAEVRRGKGPNRRAHFIRVSAADAAGDDPLFDACLTKPIERSALRRALLAARAGSLPAQGALWAARPP